MNLNEDIFTVNQNKFGFILNKTLHKNYLNNWLWSGKLITCDKYNHTRQKEIIIDIYFMQKENNFSLKRGEAIIKH